MIDRCGFLEMMEVKKNLINKLGIFGFMLALSVKSKFKINGFLIQNLVPLFFNFSRTEVDAEIIWLIT